MSGLQRSEAAAKARCGLLTGSMRTVARERTAAAEGAGATRKAAAVEGEQCSSVRIL